MELVFGYVLDRWLKKAGSTRIWVEFFLTSMDSGWGQQYNKGIDFFKGGDWFGNEDEASECHFVNKYEQKFDLLV
eukprot:11208144-Ditylum_brightwellii.AAC.1